MLASDFGVHVRSRWYHNLMVHPVAPVESVPKNFTGTRQCALTERPSGASIGRQSVRSSGRGRGTHNCEIPVVVLDPN